MSFRGAFFEYVDRYLSPATSDFFCTNHSGVGVNKIPLNTLIVKTERSLKSDYEKIQKHVFEFLTRFGFFLSRFRFQTWLSFADQLI